MTKTLPNIAKPHIRIYREIGQQVLASIEDGWTDGRTHTHTHRQTDIIELYIRCLLNVQLIVDPKIHNLQIIFVLRIGN